MAAFHREIREHALSSGAGFASVPRESTGGPSRRSTAFGSLASSRPIKAGRDPALGNYPLGFVLISHAVREALGDGMREYRLLRGGAAVQSTIRDHATPDLET